jgi:23S rRNA (cytosine1962-C5)-methyltransferase
MNLSTLEKALSSAWATKNALHGKTGAVRLLNAFASGTPGLVFELFGKHGILYDYGVNAGAWGDSLRTAASRWVMEYGWESVSVLDRVSAGDAPRSGQQALAGVPPESLTITEHDLHFRVEPQHPRNVGLFLDTRNLREGFVTPQKHQINHERASRQSSFDGHLQNARVLNLFCYTGSLGIAALAGGAAEVTQVDISSRYLDWARDNTRLNALPETRCRFVKMDSERYLDWAAKKDLKFDHIILDPPVFSRFDGKVFRWADDYFRLAAKCAALLSPGGTLYAITNYAGIRPSEFATELTGVFRDGGFKTPSPQRIALPADYDLDPQAEELPEGNAILFEITRD